MTTNANVTSLTNYLVANMSNYYMNPSSFQQIALNGLGMALNGDDIVDPSSPFIFLLEAAMTAAAVSIAKSEILTRKQYPFLAQSMQDLYNHMSDTDFVGVFGSGSTCTLNILIPYTQLLNEAIPLVNGSNVTTVIIPRDTQILVNGISLEIGYSIIINCLPGNLVQVYYDTSLINPLISENANVIPYSFVNFNNENYLQIKLPVVQLSSITSRFTLGSVNSFYQTIPIDNTYCYARVFINNGTNSWVEILTTYSDMVYDINAPTMLLAVDGNNLVVTLPDIYQSLNTVNTAVRIDVYFTQGSLEVDLTQVIYQNFSASWNNFDNLNTVNLPAISAINKINDVIISADTALTGGNNTLLFEQLYQRVIYRINSAVAPIRPSDIQAKLSIKGYSIEIIRNTVSDRMYLASKNLPPYVSNGFASSPLTTNNNITINVDGYPLNDLSSKSVISHSSGRTTILPSALFLLSNGNASLLTDDQINLIDSQSGLGLCNTLNSGLYMFTPFHYILDYSNPVFVGRSYYLQNPSISNRNLITQNSLRIYNIATMYSVISLVNNQYVLILTASIPVNIPSVICQLAYIDVLSNTTIYLNASALVHANQAVFTFNLNTNFDINTLNQLELLNFTNSAGTLEPMFVDLTTKFNLFYLVPGNNTGVATTFDDLYSTPVTQSLNGVIGATYETIKINFGQYLSNLYCPTYESLATGTFLTYTSDVLATYNETIYQTGTDGVPFIIDTSGAVVITILHNVGDPILDASGNQIILHKAGDLILSNGSVVKSPDYANSVSYSIGITMIDAKYKYATGLLTKAYASTLSDILLGYLNNDIAPMAKQLSEQTSLWYKPSGESFNNRVSLGNNVITEVPGILSVQITIYMNEDGITNTSLQTQTTELCRKAISSQLLLNVLTKTGLSDAIELILPSQATTFSLDSYLPNNATIVTLLDKTQSFSIGSQLAVMADNTLDILDAVTILYKSAA